MGFPFCVGTNGKGQRKHQWGQLSFLSGDEWEQPTQRGGFSFHVGVEGNLHQWIRFLFFLGMNGRSQPKCQPKGRFPSASGRSSALPIIES